MKASQPLPINTLELLSRFVSYHQCGVQGRQIQLRLTGIRANFMETATSTSVALRNLILFHVENEIYLLFPTFQLLFCHHIKTMLRLTLSWHMIFLRDTKGLVTCQQEILGSDLEQLSSSREIKVVAFCPSRERYTRLVYRGISLLD